MDIAEIVQSQSSPVAAAKEVPSLGREDFLSMLIAQLENQDPLNPQDATEFTAQLAQFTSLEQLISMRTSIDELANAQVSSQAMSAAGLIGRSALVATSQFGISSDAEQPLPQIFVDAGTTTRITSVEIRNAAGRVVARNDSVGTVAAGRSELDWSDFDNRPPAGQYSAHVLTESGAPTTGIAVRGRITGTTLDGDSPTLIFDGAEVSLSSLIEVHE